MQHSSNHPMKRFCKIYNVGTLYGNVRHDLPNGLSCYIRHKRTETAFTFTLKETITLDIHREETWFFGQRITIDNNHYLYVFNSKKLKQICVIEMQDVPSDYKQSFVYYKGQLRSGSYFYHENERVYVDERWHEVEDFLLYQANLPCNARYLDFRHGGWNLRVAKYTAWLALYCKLWNIFPQVGHPMELLPFTDVVFPKHYTHGLSFGITRDSRLNSLASKSSIFTELDEWWYTYDSVWDIFLVDAPTANAEQSF